MPEFRVDAPKSKVLRALERLGFRMVSEGVTVDGVETL